MTLRSVHDRKELADLLLVDPARHAYQLGDLDEFYWPYTSWYRLGRTLALLYHGGGRPTLLAFARPDAPTELTGLLTALAPLLPRRFHAHLSPGAEDALTDHFHAEESGRHLKMALTDPARLARTVPAGVPLTVADLPDLRALYELAYPDNWFDERMLHTSQYVGIREAGELLAVAGVHVWSPRWRISALGNVTTHPKARNRGLAGSAVAALCHRLRSTVDHITLNVHAENIPAVAVYTRLGFTPIADYVEFDFDVRG